MIAIALSLVLAQSAANSSSRVTRVERVPGNRVVGGRKGSRGYAFFEFAPTGGAGMGAACACTTPTGAKGEALTFTRASNGTCTKTATGGLATTGIANGDLVVCSSNQPRVEYDSNGTLGLLVESSRTNSCLRSQEFNNAAWTLYSFGTGTNPVVTADQAVAPDGTTTADRVQFSATDAAGQSGILQATGVTTGTNAVSVYVKGVSGSGSIHLSVYSTGACVTCSYVSTSWTRCTVAAAITASGHIRIGNDPAVCGGGATTAQDVYLWGAQFEAGAYATSYIPTVAASVTRSAESATFASASTVTAGNYSQAITVQSPAGSGTYVPLIAYTDASNYVGIYQSGSTWNADLRQAGVGVVATTASVGMTTPQRLVGYNDGTTQRGLLNGSAFSTPTAGTKTVSVTTLALGLNIGGVNQIDGIVTQACWQPIDPGGTRCR